MTLRIALCPEFIEACVEGVVHPLDDEPDTYSFDCNRAGQHVGGHRAMTWNPLIAVEWTEDEFAVVQVDEPGVGT